MDGVHGRCRAFLSQLLADPHHHHVLLVSHGVFLQCLLQVPACLPACCPTCLRVGWLLLLLTVGRCVWVVACCM